MNLSFHKETLQLRHPFAIARGSRTAQEVVFVELEHEGITGIGEASPSPRYKETVETTIQFLESVNLSTFNDAYVVENITEYIQSLGAGNYAAKAAIDIALQDWIGKRLNIPTWKLLGFKKDRVPKSSMTIGAATVDEVVQKVREAHYYPILKVKVGVPNDEEIVTAVRAETGKPIYIDANEGWETKEIALEKIKFMQTLGVELVEQPLPARDVEGMLWLKNRIRVPVIADESCTSVQDLTSLKGLFDGINIKLMKCGGIKPALQMIYTAKSILKMKVMIGCMIESSVGISAAAQLSPFVNYIDLDVNVLISNDPYEGVSNEEGKLILSDRPGIGAIRRK